MKKTPDAIHAYPTAAMLSEEERRRLKMLAMRERRSMSATLRWLLNREYEATVVGAREKLVDAQD